jgi:hypothetical protein
MKISAVRVIFYALLLNLAFLAPALANYDHFEDVEKAHMYKSDDERLSYIGRHFRAEFGQHGKTPPLRFCEEPDAFKCYGMYSERKFTVIDYIKPTDFKLKFESGQIAYLNTNEFIFGLHSSPPDKCIWELVAKQKPKAKPKIKKVVKKRVVRRCHCCQCCCRCCCCGQAHHNPPGTHPEQQPPGPPKAPEVKEDAQGSQ